MVIRGTEMTLFVALNPRGQASMAVSSYFGL